jgi:prepilin-type processing-associated H-X9-DG protein
VLAENPVTSGAEYYALTSYGGNGGTRSYIASAATVDGIFHTTGPASEPKPNQKPVRLSQIADGTSKTLLLGERSHTDLNYEQFAAAGWTGQSLRTWGWWGPSAGRRAIGHVVLSTSAPLNDRLAFTPENASSQMPPATDGVTFSNYADQRLTAFGSEHAGGANLTFADGSVSFISDSVEHPIFRAMGTRAKGD